MTTSVLIWSDAYSYISSKFSNYEGKLSQLKECIYIWTKMSKDTKLVMHEKHNKIYVAEK